MQVRRLCEIAADISQAWPQANRLAKDSIKVMLCLNTFSQEHNFKDGFTAAAVFLSNAQFWQGPDATRLKSELTRAMVAEQGKTNRAAKRQRFN